MARLRTGLALAVLVGSPLCYLAVSGQRAEAATILSVTSTADTNTPGTLRFALNAADATNADVEIDVQSGIEAITLTGALPTYTGGGANHNLTIDGGGVTVYGTAPSDVLASTSAGVFGVEQMTVTGGADGIDDSGGTLDVTNSTVFGNESSGVLATTGAVSLVYDTVVDNGAAGAPNANVRTTGATLSSFGSVVALARGGVPNCSVAGTTTSHGYNWSDDGSCAFTGTGDHVNADPQLAVATVCESACGEFWDPGAPLIGAIPDAHCQDDGASGVTVDEVGTTRPQLDGCDVGAIEVPFSPVCACPAQIENGYWLVGGDGGVYAFGDAPFEGSLPELGVRVHDIVGMAVVGGGYWLVGSDGGVFAFGAAHFEGSLPQRGVHVRDIVGIVASPDGGYWLVGADGGVFAFGGAAYEGSLPAQGVLVGDIVGMTDSSTSGYWLAGADGAVFALGTAAFSGSTGATHLAKPITAIAAGYVLAGADGGVFDFEGQGSYQGSLPADHVVPARPIVGIAADFGGYWLVGSDGGVFALGAVPYLGGLAGRALGAPIVGITGFP